MKYINLRLHCTVLSPIHIGTGEEIPVFTYIIENNTLLKMNLEKVISKLGKDDIQKFNEFNEKGNFLGLRNFLADLFTNKTIKDYAIEFSIPVTAEVQSIYLENIHNPANQLLIKPQIRNPVTQQPFIPGSSFKGAIRTAILSKLGEEYSALTEKGKDAEGRLLNALDDKTGKFRVQADPFKYLKISDIMLPEKSTYVCTVKNATKNKNQNLVYNKIQMLHEVCYSMLNEKSTHFYVDMLLGEIKVKNKTIDKDFIIQACKTYYSDKLKNVDFNYYQDTPIQPTLEKLISSIANTQGEFPMRIGRFSGVESITLDKHRTAKPAKSRNLAEGKYPMGWVKCKLVN